MTGSSNESTQDSKICFFVKHKDFIQSVANVTSVFGIIIAIVFSFYNSQIKPNEAHLQVSESTLLGLRKVVAYNGGQGLCVDFTISYPAGLNQKKHFVNYEETSLTNVDVSCSKNKCTSSIPEYKFSDLEPTCKSGICSTFIGVLKPNQSTAFVFEPQEKTSIVISCVDQKVESMN